MRGMDANTGRALQGRPHMRQRVARILFTALGSVVGSRDFGSILPQLVDQGANPLGRLRLLAATAGAMMRWEPEYRLRRVQLLAGDQPGGFTVDLEGEDLSAGGPANTFVRLSVPLRAPAALPAFA